MEKGKLAIETSTLGKAVPSSLDWDPSWGGFFAAEQRLEQKPMSPGETRSFMQLLPMFNQVVQLHLKAIDYESTDLLEGKRDLLRIESKMQVGGVAIESAGLDRRARYHAQNDAAHAESGHLPHNQGTRVGGSCRRQGL